MKKSIYHLLFLLIFINTPGFSQNFSGLMDGYSAYNRFWGSILICKENRVLFQKSYGYADLEHHILHGNETMFNLASVSKTITAAAILQLHDQGKLNIYDRVDKYLPGFLADDTRDLKIINLLNHTSGMEANISRADDLGNGLVVPDKQFIGRDSLIARFHNSRLKFKPGTAFEYNNYGYTLLAYIIEKVSGMDYSSYLKMHIFKPAGMTHSCFKSELAAMPSQGYHGIGTLQVQCVDARKYDPSWTLGAANIYSSANDMDKFVRAFFSNRYFSEKTKHLMLDTCVESSFPGLKWTPGWARKDNFFTHAGSDHGTSTSICYLPEQKVSIIILSNLVRDLENDTLEGAKFSFVDEIADNCIKLLKGEEVNFLPLPDDDQDTSVCGDYNIGRSQRFTIHSRNEELKLSFNQHNLFNFMFYDEIQGNDKGYAICKIFSNSLLKGTFDGFDPYVTEEMKANLFNQEAEGKLIGGWNYLTGKCGNFQSYNIYSIKSEIGNTSYNLAFHFERSEVLMTLNFNDNNKIQGLFIRQILPHSTIHQIKLYPVRNHQFFIDGYRCGGFQDFYLKFNESTRELEISSVDECFTAKKEGCQP